MKIFKLLILFLLIFPISPALAAGGASEEHPEGVPYFIEMDPLIVPIISQNRRFEVIALNLILEAETSEKSSQINQNVPRLRDGFIRSLYGRLKQDSLMDKNGVLNMVLIKDRLMAVADHVMKPGTVQNILLQGVAHQKMR